MRSTLVVLAVAFLGCENKDTRATPAPSASASASTSAFGPDASTDDPLGLKGQRSGDLSPNKGLAGPVPEAGVRK